MSLTQDFFSFLAWFLLCFWLPGHTFWGCFLFLSLSLPRHTLWRVCFLCFAFTWTLCFGLPCFHYFSIFLHSIPVFSLLFYPLQLPTLSGFVLETTMIEMVFLNICVMVVKWTVSMQNDCNGGKTRIFYVVNFSLYMKYEKRLQEKKLKNTVFSILCTMGKTRKNEVSP